MQDDLLARALRITSCFENDTPDLQWDYAEDLDDGRGWTCGVAGFTSEESKYFAPTIDPKQWHKKDFDSVWSQLAEKPAFRDLQLKVAKEQFATPAQAAFEERNCKQPITFAAFYDACIQHGDGDDPDSFGALLNDWDPEPEITETKNLADFLERRRQVLLHPANEETQEEWAESVSRVDALANLLKTNPALAFPIAIKSKDFNHRITGLINPQ
jgi:chitosanase